MVKNNQSGIPG